MKLTPDEIDEVTATFARKLDLAERVVEALKSHNREGAITLLCTWMEPDVLEAMLASWGKLK
jgi:hypothetical protein